MPGFCGQEIAVASTIAQTYVAKMLAKAFAASPTLKNTITGIEKAFASGLTSQLGGKTFIAAFLSALASTAIGDLPGIMGNMTENKQVTSAVGNGFKLMQPKLSHSRLTLPLDSITGGYWANGANWAQLY